jgi:site-specific DNA recombinase
MAIKHRLYREETGRKRVVGYVRVSTVKQAEEGLSLEVQRQRLEAWVAAQADADLVEVVVDAGRSGKRADNRAGLQKVMAMADAGEVDLVVVVKLDRIARSTRDLLDIVDRLDRREVAFVSLKDNIETGTACGRFFLTVLAGVAALEADLAGERTAEVMQAKKAAGVRFNARPPVGFRYDDGRLVEDQKEVGTIDCLKALVADPEPMSFRTMSARLAAAGHLSRTGRPYTAAQVGRLLRRLEGDRRAAA